MKVAKSYENYSWNPEKIYIKNNKKYVMATCKCGRCVNGIYPTRIENGKPVPTSIDGGICYSCKGEGFIRKEIRVYEDKEFEQIEKRKMVKKEQDLKEKYANKRKQWLAENGFNENLTTFIYFSANSYEIKEELKDAGFRFSSYLLWHAAVVPSGYEESCLEVHLDQVAELGAWGEGFYKPGIRTIVNDLLSSARPAPPASEWIGEEKEKISNLPVTLVGIRGFQGAYGYSKVVNFVTEEGNKITWFTATDIQFNQGDTLLLSATIKKLDTYNGVKSTIVTRAKLKAV